MILRHVFLATFLCFAAPATAIEDFAGPGPAAVKDTAGRIAATARMEGLLYGLRALSVEPEWFPNVNDNSGLYFRVFFLADVATALGKELAEHLVPEIEDPAHKMMLKQVAFELSNILPTVNENFDPDQSIEDMESSYLQDQVNEVEAKIKAGLKGLEDFLWSYGDAPSARVSAHDAETLKEATGEGRKAMEDLITVRALRAQLDMIATFQDDISVQEEGESFVLFQQLIELASKLDTRMEEALIHDPQLKATTNRLAQNLRNDVFLAYHKLEIDSVTDIDTWIDMAEELKGRVTRVSEGMAAAVEYAESRVRAEDSSLDAVVRTISENPSLFSSEIVSLNEQLREEQERVRAAIAELQDQERLAAAVAARSADLAQVEAAIQAAEETLARVRQAQQDAEDGYATLEQLRERITAANSQGLTDVDVKIPDPSAKVRRKYALEKVQDSVADGLRWGLSELRVKSKKRFAKVLKAKKVTSDFNVRMDVTLSSLTTARWYLIKSALKGRAVIRVKVEAYGVAREMITEIPVKLRYDADTRRTTAPALERFIKRQVRAFILTTLADANPEIGGRALSEILDRRCEDLLDVTRSAR